MISSNLVIKSNEFKRKEVIKILESLGGKNNNVLTGNEGRYYFLDSDGVINFSLTGRIDNSLTIDEFYSKFPYKIGDKVKTIMGRIGRVTKMKWDESLMTVLYGMDYNEWFTSKGIFLVEDDDENESIIDSKYEIVKSEPKVPTQFRIPDGYEFDRVEDGVIYLRSEYPSSVDECFKLMNIPRRKGQEIDIHSEEYDDLFTAMYELKVCRDAYWKLDAWKPNYMSTETKYVISNVCDSLFKGTTTTESRFLSFISERVRDEFQNNFEPLIIKCKKLI